MIYKNHSSTTIFGSFGEIQPGETKEIDEQLNSPFLEIVQGGTTINPQSARIDTTPKSNVVVTVPVEEAKKEEVSN